MNIFETIKEDPVFGLSLGFALFAITIAGLIIAFVVHDINKPCQEWETRSGTCIVQTSSTTSFQHPCEAKLCKAK